jgi:hypothetical protein
VSVPRELGTLSPKNLVNAHPLIHQRIEQKTRISLPVEVGSSVATWPRALGCFRAYLPVGVVSRVAMCPRCLSNACLLAEAGSRAAPWLCACGNHQDSPTCWVGSGADMCHRSRAISQARFPTMLHSVFICNKGNHLVIDRIN